jgi:hypothetical protein
MDVLVRGDCVLDAGRLEIYRAGAMKFHVAITYYNRPEMIAALVSDIEREAVGYDVAVHIYDDASPVSVPGSVLERAVQIIRFNHHGGKRMYYRSIQTALQQAQERQGEWDYLVFMQDDNRLAHGFFSRAAGIWNATLEMDAACRAINLWLDEQRKEETVWTNFERVLCETNAGPIWRTQWTEPTFITDRRFFSALGPMPNISPARWNSDPTLSSGVGTYISTRLNREGYTIYQVAESLLYHGDHPSLMNPMARKDRKLTSAWWPGKNAA